MAQPIHVCKTHFRIPLLSNNLNFQTTICSLTVPLVSRTQSPTTDVLSVSCGTTFNYYTFSPNIQTGRRIRLCLDFCFGTRFHQTDQVSNSILSWVSSEKISVPTHPKLDFQRLFRLSIGSEDVKSSYGGRSGTYNITGSTYRDFVQVSNYINYVLTSNFSGQQLHLQATIRSSQGGMDYWNK